MSFKGKFKEDYKLTCTRELDHQFVLSLFLPLGISKILLYFMSCRQTEKLIGELNQSVGERTKEESWRLEFRDKILARTKAKRLKSDSLRVNEKLAVSQLQRKPHHFDG